VLQIIEGLVCPNKIRWARVVGLELLQGELNVKKRKKRKKRKMMKKPVEDFLRFPNFLR
jgi:hypothetical protein